MTDLSQSLQSLRDMLGEAWRAFIEYLPHLGAALLLILVGWLVATLVRATTVRLAGGLDTVLARVSRWSVTSRRLALTPGARKLIGNIVFWVIILLFVAMAARVARLELFTIWLDRIVAYLPTLIAGGLILLAGYFVSSLVRDLVVAALDSAGSTQSEFLGRMAQATIFVAAMVIGLDQIGINITFLTILFSIVIGGLLLSLALAFGFGSQVLVANLLGARQLQKFLEPGQIARVSGIEGQVLELTATTVVLATEDGRMSVPAKFFQEEAVLIKSADDDD